jgi:CAAX prenyl protease-like protein
VKSFFRGAVLLGWPVLAALLIGRSGLFPPSPGGTTLAGFVFALLAISPAFFMTGVHVPGRLGREVLAGALLVTLFAASGKLGTTPIATTVLYLLALQEEYVFRYFVHDAIPVSGRVTPAVLSQLSFALAHLASSPMSVGRVGELLVVGVFLLSLRDLIGLGGLAALHTLANVPTMQALVGPPPASPLELLLLGAIASALLPGGRSPVSREAATRIIHRERKGIV